MATATILEDSPVEMSVETNSVLSSKMEQTPSPEPVQMLDWQASLSPSRRSCIKLINVEPCVNKAVAHLTSLKDRLTECARNHLSVLSAIQEAVTESQLGTPKSVTLCPEGDSQAGAAQRQSSQLMIEGVTTGILVEKHRKSTARKVW